VEKAISHTAFGACFFFFFFLHYVCRYVVLGIVMVIIVTMKKWNKQTATCIRMTVYKYTITIPRNEYNIL